MRRTVAVVLAAFAAITFACDRGDDDDRVRDRPTRTPRAERTVDATARPEPTASAAFDVKPVEWEECGRNFDCGTLEAPLDHTDPGGETIELALLRIPAGDPDERIGSLLVNPGGPGGSGVEFVRLAGSFIFSRELRQRFDIVGFDPRGVGESEPAVDCADNLDDFFSVDPSPDSQAEADAQAAVAREFVAGCEERSGDVLPFVSTEDAARDMDLIRIALGEEKLTYIGFSYGTFLGAVYAELFPERIRAFVLDGAADPAQTAEEQIVAQFAGFERALDAFFDDCAADDDCDFHSDGNPASAFDALFAEIEWEPLSSGDDDDPREVGPGLAWLGVIASLYDETSGWAALARGLAEAAEDGDGSGLLLLADLYAERQDDGTYANLFEANVAVNCLDTERIDPARYPALAQRIAEAAPRVGATNGFYTPPTCSFWPVPPSGAPRRIAAAGAPPIVVIGTTGDPATPYEQAVSLADQLEAGILLTFDGEGHTAYGTSSDCIDDAVDAYLIDLEAPADGTVCE